MCSRVSFHRDAPENLKAANTLGYRPARGANWSACKHFRWNAEGAVHHETLTSLLRAAKVIGPQIHDARIAAVCLARGVQCLWSVDRDFTRFRDLNVRNPLLDQ